MFKDISKLTFSQNFFSQTISGVYVVNDQKKIMKMKILLSSFMLRIYQHVIQSKLKGQFYIRRKTPLVNQRTEHTFASTLIYSKTWKRNQFRQYKF